MLLVLLKRPKAITLRDCNFEIKRGLECRTFKSGVKELFELHGAE